ncbi:TonB-dependent receptor plug domain-containing protein [candidate division KSB1 bacterium]|nr:TonB-dependent receptor plug domain-containing protein [candidate division KSB1 bacterium]
MKLYILPLYIFFIFTALPVSSQQISKIQGSIFDRQTQNPIPFVNVSISGSNLGTTTNPEGIFQLTLPAGSYQFVFSMIGYKTYKEDVTFAEGENVNLSIELSPTVIYLPGVTIIAGKTKKQRQQESISSISFETQKVRDLPFSLNDVNRALKTLPGISSNNEKSSEFNVRGGSFEENLVLVDGVTIYRPFHLKELPNASISMINMALMKRVNLITGGFPAKYGDKMSSVLEIDYRNGNADEFQSQIEIGAINTNVILEGPVADEFSWIVGFNKSYFEPSFRLINEYFPDLLESIHGTPRFYDIQGKLNYQFNPSHDVSLVFLNAGDDYNEEPVFQTENYTRNINAYRSEMTTEGTSNFDSNFRSSLAALQFSNWFTNSLYSKTTLSYYDELEDIDIRSENNTRNEFYVAETNEYRGFSNYNNIDIYRLILDVKTTEIKSDLIFKTTPYQELETGFYFQNITYLYRLDDLSERIAFYNLPNYPDTADIDTLFYDDNYNDTVSLESHTYKLGGYLQNNWQISNSIFINTGLRCDYLDFNKNLNFSPRISFSYAFKNEAILKFAWGIYYQSPLYHEFKYQHAGSNNTQNQKAIHYITSYQQNITDLFQVKVDFYYKDYKDLIPYYIRKGYKLSTQENSAVGYARGFDLQFKYNINNLSGWLSYGFLVAEENIEHDDIGYYPRATNQRHSLAMVVDWNISDNWRIYGKFLYGSGFPFTPITFDLKSQRFVDGEINSEYLPEYKRVDLRVSRYFNFDWGDCSIYFEVINVLNNSNIFSYQEYGFDEYGNITREAKKLLPITPNMGFKIML